MVTGWPNLSNPADDVFFFILGISITLLALNTAVMIYFVIRYRKKRHPQAEEVQDNASIEILWTVIPTVLVLIIFFVGWKGFQYMRTVPPDAMRVNVTARQWSWSFRYENGKQDSVLRVPVHKPVKLLLTSADVLHSLFIPAFRVKEDCVPGRETYLWFRPEQTGSYDLFCTEYCGVGHANMITKVEVMNEQDYDAWYRSEPAGAAPGQGSTIQAGEKFVQVKGCIACHSVDGSTKVGPSFKSIFGKKQPVLHEGKEREVTVDAAFIKEKLMHPEINRIKGFPPIMPSQQGQLTDAEVDSVIEYLKSLQ